MLSAEEIDAAAIRACEDPVFFAEQFLGQTLWSKQVEICEKIARLDRVAVRSGHKVSKSRTAAIIAIWFAFTRPGARVVMTSSTSRQIRFILWRELKSMCASAGIEVTEFTPTPLSQTMGATVFDDPGTGIRFEHGSEIFGFSTNQPENMAGISGADILFIIDEASGVPETIFEAIEGNRAGGAKLLLLSNPTRTSGTFFEAFHAKRQFWGEGLIHVSSEESPNVTGECDIPGLATAAWVNEKRLEWGEDSVLFQVRCRGNFPSADARAVVTLDLVDDARERYDATPAEGPLSLGLDPAYTGDTSALAAVRGLWSAPIKAWQGLDPLELARAALDHLTTIRRGNEPVQINVEVNGLGYGVFAALKAAKTPGVTVVPINMSSSPTVTPKKDEPGYLNMRAQLWFGVTSWLKEGGAIAPDSLLESDLVAPLWETDLRGRILIEPKDKIKDKLGRSPDRGDALCLAVYHAPARTQVATALVKKLYNARAARPRHEKATP